MRLIITILFCFSGLFAFSQKFEINGIVSGEDDEVLQSATAVLLAPQDSSLVAFGLTDAKGRFRLSDVSPNSYLLQITYLGYEQYKDTLDLTNQKSLLDLGKIVMMQDRNKLSEVVIEGEHTPIMVKKDTLEYNANAFQTQPNEMVEDLLKKLPGVEIDAEGTIVAQGEEVEKVLVDGKEFFGSDTKLATKNLPAKSVDKIQFYDKKSDKADFSGVDDGVREKTMNLELKEDYKKGIFGGIEVGAGADELENLRYENRLTLSRFTPKTQLSVIGNLNNINKQGFSSGQYMSVMSSMGGFGGGRNSGLSFGGGLSDGFVDTGSGGINFNYDITKALELNISYFINDISNTIDETTVRENFNPEGGSFFNIDTLSSISKNTNHTIQSKIELEIDSTQELQINLGFNANDPLSALEEHRITQDNFGITNNLFNDYNSDNATTLLNWNSKFLYQKRLGKRFFSVEGRYNEGQQNLLGEQNSLNVLDTNGDFWHGYNSFDDQQSYSVDLSYVEPLGGGNYLEFGYMYSNSVNDYGLTTDDLLFNTAKQIDSLSNSNNRDYVYHQYGLSFQKNSESTNFTLGLDLQQSLLNGTFAIPNEGGPDVVKQTVETPNLQLLPNFQWRYQLGKSKRISLNYNTKVREPSLEQLQLRKDISDPLNIYVGNPNLTMEYEHRMRVHFFNYNQFNFSSIFAFLSTTYIQNKITNQTTISDGSIKTISPINVKDDLNIRGVFNYSTPIRKLKIKTRLSVNANYRNNYVFTNGIEDKANRYTGGFGIRFENRQKEFFDAEIGGKWNFNAVNYDVNDRFNSSYINQSYYTNWALSAIKSWNFKTGLDVNYYSQETFGEAAVIPIWTASISKYFLAGNRGEIRLSAFDLLNQNAGISRSSNLNYIESREINSLGRYYMCSFIYSVKGGGDDAPKMKVTRH